MHVPARANELSQPPIGFRDRQLAARERPGHQRPIVVEEDELPAFGLTIVEQRIDVMMTPPRAPEPLTIGLERDAGHGLADCMRAGRS